jgi:hypothetical protein
MSIKYYECAYVSLVIQHAMRVRYIMLSSLVCLGHILAHYLINGTIFGEKGIEHKMCVLIFSTTFV